METTGVAETMSRNMSFREIILAGTGEDEGGVVQDIPQCHAELISDRLVLRPKIEKGYPDRFFRIHQQRLPVYYSSHRE